MAAIGWAAKDEVRAGGEWFGYLFAFGLLQIFVVVLDGADGILARRTGTTTRRGHLLDSLFDIAGIGITLGTVMHLYSQWEKLAFALLFVNFLVYLQNEIQGTKSITHTRGPVTIALYLAPLSPYLLPAGLAIPLAIGIVLMATRVSWRKRLWNWYQFLTAGQRQEYKAVPREQRATLTPRTPVPRTAPAIVSRPSMEATTGAPDPIDRFPEKPKPPEQA